MVVVGVVDVVFRLDSGVDADVAVTVVAGVVVVVVFLLKATVAVEELGRDEGLMGVVCRVGSRLLLSSKLDLRSNSGLAFSQEDSVTSLTSM